MLTMAVCIHERCIVFLQASVFYCYHRNSFASFCCHFFVDIHILYIEYLKILLQYYYNLAVKNCQYTAKISICSGGFFFTVLYRVNMDKTIHVPFCTGLGWQMYCYFCTSNNCMGTIGLYSLNIFLKNHIHTDLYSHSRSIFSKHKTFVCFLAH